MAIVRNLRRLPHDVGDWKTILACQRHVHARHQRKVKCHVAFIALAEVILGILRPLVRLGEQHASRIRHVEFAPYALEDLVRLGKVLVIGAIPLDQIRHCVEPQSIDAHFQPEAHH